MLRFLSLSPHSLSLTLPSLSFSHFPLTHFLSLSRTHSLTGSDVVLLDATETRDLLMCFMAVLKNLDSAFIAQWWRVSISPVLFDVVLLCLQNFQYIGKDAITSPTNMATIQTMNAKRSSSQSFCTACLLLDVAQSMHHLISDIIN
jgi:hypothetical protein